MATPEDEVSEQVAFLRAWVERHHRHHDCPGQWYVDEHVVDVDADELWQVLGHGLRLWHQRLARGTDTFGDTCVCGHPRDRHEGATVDVRGTCLSCGCWGFTSPVPRLDVPPAPVAPEGVPRHA